MCRSFLIICLIHVSQGVCDFLFQISSPFYRQLAMQLYSQSIALEDLISRQNIETAIFTLFRKCCLPGFAFPGSQTQCRHATSELLVCILTVSGSEVLKDLHLHNSKATNIFKRSSTIASHISFEVGLFQDVNLELWQECF